MTFAWNSQLVEEVAVFLKEGWSAAQIGAQIGTSRNAVIGKVGRDENLSRIGFAWNRVQPFVGKHPERLKAIRGRKPRLVKLPRKERPVLIKTLPFQVAGKPMLMLEAKECRWVVNDAAIGEQHLFCAVNTEVGHYCEHHRNSLFQRNATA